jgi:hypothetical protein
MLFSLVSQIFCVIGKGYSKLRTYFTYHSQRFVKSILKIYLSPFAVAHSRRFASCRAKLTMIAYFAQTQRAKVHTLRRYLQPVLVRHKKPLSGGLYLTRSAPFSCCIRRVPSSNHTSRTKRR